MELYLSIWQFHFALSILVRAWELGAFRYMCLEIRFRQWRIGIQLLREDRGGFRFRIHLPFIHIANDVQRKVIKRYVPEEGVEMSFAVPVITGKIFGKVIPHG